MLWPLQEDEDGNPIIPALGARPGTSAMRGVRPYLTLSVFKVVLQKSIPPQIRQRILYYR